MTPETLIIIFASGPGHAHEREIARTGAREQVVGAMNFKELLFSLRYLLSDKKELALATV